jgi:hypothetical protein
MLTDSDELGSCEGNVVSRSPSSVDGASLGEILGRVDGLALSDGVAEGTNSSSRLGETDGAKLIMCDGIALGPLDGACDTGELVNDASLGEPLGLMDDAVAMSCCCDGEALGPCDGLSVGDFSLCETLGLVDGVSVRTSFSVVVGDRVGLVLMGDDDSEHGKVMADLEDFVVPPADLPIAEFDPLDDEDLPLLQDFKVFVDFDAPDLDKEEDALFDFVDLTWTRSRCFDTFLGGIVPFGVVARSGLDCHLTVDCCVVLLRPCCYCSSSRKINL